MADWRLPIAAAAIFVAALGLGVAATAHPAEAPRVGKVPRIGFLSPGSTAASPNDAFRQGLRELGYVEGQNLIVEYRWGDGDAARLPALAAELVRLRVEVLVASSNPAILAARQATSTIPIVFAAGSDPVSTGL